VKNHAALATFLLIIVKDKSQTQITNEP